MKKIQVGFTLTELLVYMAVLSVLLVVLTDIFVTVIENRLEYESQSSIASDGRFILTRLMYDIGRADTITTPASLGEETPALQMTASGINYTYTVNGDNLEATDNTGAYQLNSVESTISNVRFKRLGNVSGKHMIQISFSVTSKTRRKFGLETSNFQTTVGLR